MSKLNKTDVASALGPGVRSGRGAAVMVLAGALILGFVCLGWWILASPDAPQASTADPVGSISRPAPAAEVQSDFQKLKGKWIRPDGGYVLDIRSVTDGGKMDASYSNPQSIHVSKAQASQDGLALKVFFELRDVNYPGSTYDLTYDPQGDVLKGIYFQAAIQQRFEVVFTRMH